MISTDSSLRPEGAQKRKDIIILAFSVLVLLFAVLFIPVGEAMANGLSSMTVFGKATDIVPVAPEERVQIPFLAQMEELTEVSFYLLHFPEEEEGDFCVTIRDAEGQTLFETGRPLSELPHEDFGRFPVGIPLTPGQSYICEVRHTGESPSPGVRLVTTDMKLSWFSGKAIHETQGEIRDGILMHVIFFRPPVLYLLIAKVLLMVIAACGIIHRSVKLCREGAA